jgi:type VI secretion system protein VasG
MSELKTLIERLDRPCRRALETAAALCVSHTNFQVEIEHYLAKLIEAEGTDLQVIFRYYDIDTTRLERQLELAIDKLKRGNSATPAMSRDLPRLLAEAWTVSSVRLGSQATRSAGILAARLEGDSYRQKIVESCPLLTEIPLERLREDLPELLPHSDEHAASGGAPADAGDTPSRGKRDAGSPTPSLDQYTINLTADARAGKIDPIRGRDPEIRQVIDILTRRRQNNPILVGDAGVGKTAIVEGFARKVAAGEVPKSLEHVSVRILDLGLLQAGAGIKGEFEERLKKVIEEVKSSPHPVILFVDEAHNLIGAGGTSGQGDAANLLKPALARGDLRTIAATTWSEYKKYFEKDPALTRRFQLIRVEEPDEDTAIDMLRGIAANLASHHQVRILDEAVRDAVRLSARYLSERRLPDKAISVLDTSCARVALAKQGIPQAIEDVDRRIQPLELEIESLRNEADTSDHSEELARLEEDLENARAERQELDDRWQKELELAEKVAELETRLAEARAGDSSDDENAEKIGGEIAAAVREAEELQGPEPMVPLRVDSRVVTSVISGWTGIPVGRMMTDEIRGILALEQTMAERLIGQPQALSAICKRISTSSADLEDPEKPRGVFLLVGPSGVGKTETAIVLADLLFGGKKNIVTLNMSEFQEPHSVATLKGSPPGYVGYGEGGVLTEAVRRRPYSVVLLDEAEKAHTDVMELFYQVFDKGVLEDGEGVPVDFKNTIILLTSNIASDRVLAACDGEDRPGTAELIDLVRPTLLDHFKPALLGRLAIVPYYPLTDGNLRQIVELKLAAIQDRIMKNHAAELTWDDDVVANIAASCDEADTGARNIDNLLTQTLLPELSGELLQRMAEGGTFSGVHLTAADDGRFVYTIEE